MDEFDRATRLAESPDHHRGTVENVGDGLRYSRYLFVDHQVVSVTLRAARRPSSWSCCATTSVASRKAFTTVSISSCEMTNGGENTTVSVWGRARPITPPRERLLRYAARHFQRRFERDGRVVLGNELYAPHEPHAPYITHERVVLERGDEALFQVRAAGCDLGDESVIFDHVEVGERSGPRSRDGPCR